MTVDDMALVCDYTENQSETAFAALVERHLNLVYSAALRQVGNPVLAEEAKRIQWLTCVGMERGISALG